MYAMHAILSCLVCATSLPFQRWNIVWFTALEACATNTGVCAPVQFSNEV